MRKGVLFRSISSLWAAGAEGCSVTSTYRMREVTQRPEITSSHTKRNVEPQLCASVMNLRIVLEFLGLPVKSGGLAVELVDVADAVDEEVLAGRRHLGWRGGVTPLEDVAVSADSDRFVALAGSEAEHDGLGVGRVLGPDRPADYALDTGQCLLDVPDLHFLAELHALRQGLEVASGRVDGLQFDFHLQGLVENLVIERLTMSRIS